MSNNIEVFEYNNPNARFGFTPNSILNLKEMSNNKQNSIDWLISILNKPGFDPVLTDEEIQQAKQMHKEEIEDAWINGMKEQMIAPFAMNRYKPEAQEYYTKTFGGDTGVIVFDDIRLTNTSGTNHLSHINPLTDKLTNGGDNE